MSHSARPVIVAGIPRSGTTWVGKALARAGSRCLVHEPDNEKESLSALIAKRWLGRFPVLQSGEAAPSYERLWELALAGATPDESTRRRRLVASGWRGLTSAHREAAVRRTESAITRAVVALAGPEGAQRHQPAPVVVKTVHAPLALEWLSDRFVAAQVVVVIRHPASVLSSWRELELADQDRQLHQNPRVQRDYLARWNVEPPGTDPLERAAWQVCLLTAVLLDAVARRPGWHLVRHEDLCVDPPARFAALARGLGMAWNDLAEAFLLESDQGGAGFAVRRRASEQVDRWRSRLEPGGARALAAAAGQFPGLGPWVDDLREVADRSRQG